MSEDKRCCLKDVLLVHLYLVNVNVNFRLTCLLPVTGKQFSLVMFTVSVQEGREVSWL